MRLTFCRPMHRVQGPRLRGLTRHIAAMKSRGIMLVAFLFLLGAAAMAAASAPHERALLQTAAAHHHFWDFTTADATGGAVVDAGTAPVAWAASATGGGLTPRGLSLNRSGSGGGASASATITPAAAGGAVSLSVTASHAWHDNTTRTVFNLDGLVFRVNPSAITDAGVRVHALRRGGCGWRCGRAIHRWRAVPAHRLPHARHAMGARLRARGVRRQPRAAPGRQRAAGRDG
jgi:hypothetical protein